MTIRRLSAVILAAMAALMTAALFFLTRPESLPTLAEVAGLAGAGNLAEAESRLDILLKREPLDPGANLLSAQIKMARCEQETKSGIGTDPQPAASALESLRRVESRDDKIVALARLWQGKAERYLGQLDAAEESWLEALRLDPVVPEAAWLLLQEYYLQGRSQEAQTLALRLHQTEPDPRDRVRFLLEPLRQEIMPPDPSSLVLWFEPIATLSPGSLRSNVALGLAMIRSGDVDRGMDLLRKTVERYPQRSEAWNALMAGLDEVGDLMALAESVRTSPSIYSSAPWIFRYKGRVAEDGGDWAAAAIHYRRALQVTPADTHLDFRLARSLRRIGETVEADRFTEKHRTHEALSQEARNLYMEAINCDSSGISHHPELCERIAALREKMGYPEQALAWHRLAEGPIRR